MVSLMNKKNKKNTKRRRKEHKYVGKEKQPENALKGIAKLCPRGMSWGARRWSGYDAMGLGPVASPEYSKPPVRTDATTERRNWVTKCNFRPGRGIPETHCKSAHP